MATRSPVGKAHMLLNASSHKAVAMFALLGLLASRCPDSQCFVALHAGRPTLLPGCVLLQTKPALCNGLKSGAVEVSNFPLPAQDEGKWAKVSKACQPVTPGRVAHRGVTVMTAARVC